MEALWCVNGFIIMQTLKPEMINKNVVSLDCFSEG